MNSRDQHAEEILAAAMEIADPAARNNYLDLACGDDVALRQEVKSLLASHAQAGEFLKTKRLAGSQPAFPSEKSGDRIGRYKLLEQIGEGGFGVVWMAEQEEPVRRRVALKIIKLGMDTREVIARFEAERQALALMEHPHIASVFDGGATDTGRPYFVMELVKGLSITEYCDANKLSTTQRLELFAQVCLAVQHAHQKGIIHRDLKPSNILVTVKDDKPVPKVIDFGVAKATEARLTERTYFTQFRQWIGTPAYMSPEQAGLASLDVDTRSDVYSLGVLLYELLTGRTPFDTQKLLEKGYEAVMRTIREDEPPKPSTRLSTLNDEELGAVAMKRGAAPAKLNRLVHGDLDWIVMKALEKDRTRRYESANGMAMDIRRHLRKEPVSAAAPTLTYRFQKLVRRNPTTFAAVTAVALTLLITTIVSVRMAVVAERARAIASHERDLTRQAKEAEAEQRRLAEAQAKEVRERLVRARVASGLRFMEEKDYFRALPWFVEALKLDADNPEGELEHRVRIASVLRASPTLLRLWTPGGLDATAAFNAGGDWIAVRDGDDRVRVWSVDANQPVSPSLSHGEPGAEIGLRFRPGHPELLTFGPQWARLWQVNGGSQLKQFELPRLSSVAFSSDGRWLAVGSQNGRLVVRAVDSGAVVFSNAVHRSEISALCFSPDNQRLAVADHAGAARIWVVTNGTERVAVRHGSRLDHVEFDPSGRHFATASFDGTARIWDVETGAPITPALKHRGGLWRVRFSPDGQSVVTCGLAGNAHVWDATTGEHLLGPLEHAGQVLDCRFSPDGQMLATRGLDGVVKVWRMMTLKLVAPPLWHGRGVNEVTFHPDNKRLLTASADGQVRLWDLRSQDPLLQPPELSGRKVLEASSTGDFVLAERADHELTLHETRTWQPVGSPVKESGGLKGWRLNAAQMRVLSLVLQPTDTTTCRANLWDFNTGKLISSASVPAKSDRNVISPDCRFVALVNGESVEVFECATGRKVAGPLTVGGRIRSLGFSAKGDSLALTAGTRVKVWNLTSSQETFPALLHPHAVAAVEFSRDGRWLVTSCSDAILAERDAQVWDAHTGQPVGAPITQPDGVPLATFSENSELLATGCEDGTARVWNPITGQPVSPRLMLPSHVISASFARNNRWFAAGGNTTLATARVWVAKTGEPLSLPMPHNQNIWPVWLLANGRCLFTRSGGVSRLWNLNEDVRPLEDLEALSSLLSGHRLDSTGALEPLNMEELSRVWTNLHVRYPRQFDAPTPASGAN